MWEGCPICEYFFLGKQLSVLLAELMRPAVPDTGVPTTGSWHWDRGSERECSLERGKYAQQFSEEGILAVYFASLMVFS